VLAIGGAAPTPGSGGAFIGLATLPAGGSARLVTASDGGTTRFPLLSKSFCGGAALTPDRPEFAPVALASPELTLAFVVSGSASRDLFLVL
jgi:hypothetical protein